MFRTLNDPYGDNPAPTQARSPFAGCWAGTPAITKCLTVYSIVSSIVGSLTWNSGIFPYIACCPDVIYSSEGVTTYTFLTSYLIDISLLSGLFAAMSLYQTTALIETKRGSLFVLWTFIIINLLTNAIWIGIAFAIGVGLQYPLIMKFCSYGMWNTVFAFMAIETTITAPEQPNRSCCGMFDVPTKYYPFILLFVFELLLGFTPTFIIALALGYLYIHTSFLQLSYPIATSIEQWRIMKVFTSMTSYVFVNNANAFELFNPLASWAQPSLAHEQSTQQASSSSRTGGSGSASSGGSHVVTIGSYGSSGSGSDAKKPQTSVFTQSKGHKLTDPSSTSTASSSAAPYQSSASSSSASSTRGTTRVPVDRLLAKGNKPSKQGQVQDNEIPTTEATQQQQQQASSTSTQPPQRMKNSVEEVDFLSGTQQTGYQPVEREEK